MDGSAAPGLRIAMVCSATSGTYGAVRSMMTLAGELRRDGHTVVFTTFRGRKFGQEVRAEGYLAEEVSVRLKIDLLASIEMARQFRRNRIDVVHTHLSTSSVNGCLAARIARLPSVSTVHGLSSKHSFAFAHHLIAVAESGRQHLMAQGVRPERITVVWNGIDRRPGPWPTREIARPLLGLDPGTLVTLTTGRVTEMKGPREGLEAIAEVAQSRPNLTHVFLGDGDDIDGNRKLAAELGIADRVVFAGYQTDIKPYLAAADIFLFPSRKESLPMSLIEAMLEGLPVVATAAGGVSEVVTPDTGIVVPVGDVHGLASGIERFAADPALRSEFGSRGRARALDRFSAATMAKATEAVYRRTARTSG